MDAGRILAIGAVVLLVACAPAAQPAPAGGPAQGAVPEPTAAPAAAAAAPAKAAPAQSAAYSSSMQELIEGARKEGALTLVWGQNSLGGTEGARQLEERVNKKYGLNLTLNFTVGPAGPATGAKIVQEVAAGQTAHTDLHLFVDASNNKAFQPVEWRKYVPELPEDAIFYENRAAAIYTQLPGITYNKNLVPADKIPASLEDLLDPWWKNKIAAPPYAYTIQFQAVPEFLGYDRAMSFMQRYSAHLGGLIRCGEDDRVLSGEFLAFALDCGDYQVRKRQRLGHPLGHVIPSEGGALKYYDPAVPVTAPHPNAAKLLVAFLVSREGQEWLWEVEASDLHKLPGSKMSEVMKTYQERGVKFLDAITLEQQYPDVAEHEKEMVTILQKAQS